MLAQESLIRCLNWKSYIKNKTHKPQRRRFIAQPRLYLTVMTGYHSSSFGRVKARNYDIKEVYGSMLTHKHPKRKVSLPSVLTEKLQEGYTGLLFDLNKFQDILHGIDSPADRYITARSAYYAIGCSYTKDKGLIRVHAKEYSQKNCGRIYARGGALCNLKRIARAALISDDPTRAVYNVDFRSMEPQFILAENDRCNYTKRGDIYYKLWEKVKAYGYACAQGDIKSEVVALLHGRTEDSLWDNKKISYQDKLKSTALIPLIYKAWQSLYKFDLEATVASHSKHHLQSETAKIFFASVNMAMKKFDTPLGILLHDGWYFVATEAEAKQVKTFF